MDISVRGTREYVDDQVLPSSSLYTIWLKQVPRKINVYLWRLALDRLPTRLNLLRRGIEIQTIRCVSCDIAIESIHHVMFDCEVASDLWRRIRIWTEMSLPIFSEWVDWIAWYEEWRESEDTKVRLYVIVASTVWHIWRFRNSQK
ncbi:uncharacterized protein [Rutidosis leptorrhynchoides]|uniref:uncharacterized protein n=1 Tax=Rutidosis leptorrhynchoides TaxID=125765 RepID=UPI003A99A685